MCALNSRYLLVNGTHGPCFLPYFLPDLAGCTALAVRGGLATLSLSLGFLGFFLLMGSAMYRLLV